MMSDQQSTDAGTPTFPYSVKIERTARGARFSVHVYNKDGMSALGEAVSMYVSLAKMLETNGQVVAPVEVGKD